MAILTGTSGTGNIPATLIARDVYKKILPARASMKVLVIMLQKMNELAAKSTKVEHHEIAFKPFQAAIGAGYTAASGTIDIPDGYWEQLVAGQLLKSQKWGTVLRVETTPTSSTVAVGTTVWGESVDHNMLTGDYVIILPVAKEEGASAHAVRSEVPSPEFNYTAIIEEPWEVTGTANAIEQYGKPSGDYDHEKLQHIDEFQIKEELAILFGERFRDASTGTHPRQMMRGIYKWATDGGKAQTYTANALTDLALMSFVEMCAAESDEPALLLASLRLLREINSMAVLKLTLNPEKKAKYGFDVYELITGFRTVYITPHRLISGDLEGYGVLVTPDKLWLRDLRGVHVVDDTQSKKDDVRAGLVRREFTIMMSHKKSFGLIYPA